jgi:parvulin-like peptidyl-prolyl isomerase
MKLSRWAMLTVAPIALAACGQFSSAMTSHTDVVAKAAGKELKVEDAAALLAANPQIPEDPQMVQILADLWVDYMLLATAVAEDSTLAVLDMDRFTADEREQMTLMRYLEHTVAVDTAFTDAQLEERWTRDGPGVEVRARHVLLRTGPESTPAQRDSVRRQAAEIAARAKGGEDFAALARQYSQDGTREQGGDLGFFGRGRMVAPFEEAAFALRPGEVSDVVESPFGYHVIRVEERRQQDLGENRQAFRESLVQETRGRAMQAYIDSVKTAAGVQVQPNAADLVREIAGAEGINLRGRQAERVLVSYRGGAFTAGDLNRFLRGRPAQLRGMMAGADAEQINEFLEEQALRQHLLGEAGRSEFALSPAAADSIRADARRAVRELVEASGFAGQRVPRGAQGNAALEAQVRALMQAAVTGERQVPQLGPLAAALRDAYGSDVNTSSFGRVIERMRTVRATQPQPAMPAPGSPHGEGVGAPDGP